MALRILIDACVLYPTVMREMVMGAARAGVGVEVRRTAARPGW